MGNTIDFEKAKRERDQKVEEDLAMRAQIERNLHLQYAIKIMNNIPIYDVNEKGEPDIRDYDYVSLLNDYKEQCAKNNETFQSLGEIRDEQVQFYYQLFQMGYRTFGAAFFKEMCMNEVNCVQMFVGIWALINGLETMSEGTMSLEQKVRAYESLELTDEQKAKFQEQIKKTPQEFLEELMKQSEELEKQNEDNN